MKHTLWYSSYRSLYGIGALLLLTLYTTTGVAQLLPNTYTPITTANGLDPALSANDQFCGGLDVSCVTNLANLDGALNAAATISVALSTNWIEVGFNEIAPAGSYAGFVIESGISLGSDISITVSNDTDSETLDGNNFLSLGITGSTEKIGFYPTITFDRIRITYGGIGLTGSLDVFYAEVMKFEAADPLVCNVPTIMNRPEFPLTDSTAFTGAGNSVSNPEFAVDATTTNYAELIVPVVGSASLYIKDELSSYLAGTYVGFDIESTSILSLTVLNGISIRTYLNGVWTTDEYSGIGGLSAVGLLGSSVTRVGFLATEEFDEIEITASSTGGLNLGTIRVYNAVIQCFELGPGLPICNEPTILTAPVYPVYISERTGISGTINTDTKIIEAGNVIDAIPGNYAELNFTSIVNSEVSLGVKDAITNYPAETFAGFDIENTASLLDLAFLKSITISTYLEGVFQESSTGNNLAFGSSLISGSERQTVGFVTTTTFDEVVITLDGDLLGVSLGTTRVYGVVLKCFAEGPALACNTNTFITESTYPIYIDMANTGVTGTLGANNSISDLSNILDDDTDNYALVTQTGSISSTATIAVKKALSPIASQTFVAFDIENPNVLSTDLLTGISVSIYSGGTLIDTISSSNLISIGSSTLNGSGRQLVGLIASSSFDEARLTINAGLISSNLGSTRVYGMVLKKFCSKAIPECNTLTPGTNPEFPVYINGVNTGITGIGCVGCAINDVENVIDSDINNFATVEFLTGVGNISLSVANALDDYDANTFVGFDLEFQPFLGVDVLNAVTIELFKDGGSVQTSSGSALLAGVSSTALVGNYTRQPVGIIAYQAFDEVKITFAQTSAVSLGEIRVYNALFTKTCAGTLSCDETNYLIGGKDHLPVYINSERTGTSGLVDGLTKISDPWNVVTENLNDFAEVEVTAGGGGSASISVVDATNTYPAGTIAGFVVSTEETGLVQTNLFQSLTITTYLDGVEQETGTGDDILNLDVLGLITVPAAELQPSFMTTLPFDEVQISFSGIAGLLNHVRVYSAFADFRYVNDGGSLSCYIGSYNPDFNSAWVNVTVNGDVSTNDQPLGTATYGTPTAVSGNPTGGTITMNMNSNGTYDFTASEPGVYNFDVPVCVGTTCTSRRLQITVLDGSITTNPPVANPDYGTGLAGQPIVINSVVNDKPGNEGENMNIATIDTVMNMGPRHGTATINTTTGEITYTPDPGFTGRDSLLYTICDDGTPEKCATAWQYFTVNPAGLESTTDATDDFATTRNGTAVSGNVSDNDVDPQGLPQTVQTQSFTEPGVGDFTLAANGDYTFTPVIGFSGSHDFVYTTCQTDHPSVCASATLHILVEPGDAKPDFNVTTINVAVDGNVNTNDDLPAGTTYGTPVEDSNNPSGGGSITMNTDGTYTFTGTIAGVYEYDVPVCVPGGPNPCPTTRLTITVLDSDNPTSNPPVANTDYGTVFSNGSIEIATLANDGPGYPAASLDPASVTITSGPSNGSTFINTGTGNITYTPNTGFVGKDSLKYEVCDDSNPALCATAWQYFTVIPQNSPNSTTAVDDYLYVQANTPASGNVSTNDSDPEGDGQTVMAQTTTLTGKGTLELNTDGSYTFTPVTGFTGPVEFTYNTCDDGTPSACAMATLYVLVGEDTKPDLTPTITVLPSIVEGVTNLNVRIRVSEISGNASNGLITVQIPASGDWTINLALNAIVGDFTYKGLIGGKHQFTTSNVIQGNGLSTFNFGVTYDPDGSDGSFTFTSIILGGSGGEEWNGNNTNSERVDYFAN